MLLLDRLTRKSATADLVKRGLENQETVTTKQIRDCIYLLANAMGDTWKQASKEAAAGMVLMALAKNRALQSFLSACGWTLVAELLRSNPRLKRDLSSRMRDEIDFYLARSVSVAA